MDKKIEEFRNLINDVNKIFLREDQPNIFDENFEYLKEVFCLYAKQSNLVSSTLLLVENNYLEEAIVLARSVLNNYFLIVYLLNDNEKREHLKQYLVQPLISEKIFLNDLKEINEKKWFKKLAEKNGKEFNNNKFKKLEEELIEKAKKFNVDLSRKKIPKNLFLSIAYMAKEGDESTFYLYKAFYRTASKYEHSDSSTLKIYKEAVFENKFQESIFSINLSKTDESLKESIIAMIKISFGDSLLKIIEEIKNKGEWIKTNYNEDELNKLIFKVNETCMNLQQL